MINILIVDDRADARITLRETIELHLPENAMLSVSDTFPLDNVDDYASFIREHDIAALLLDERLNEAKSPETGEFSAYLGHDVVERLRQALPEFPVYVVTTHNEDEALVVNAGDFEDIVERDLFQREPLKYIARINRAAMRFQETMKERLAELNSLTLKAAQGNLSKDEGDQLERIRTILGLPFSTGSDLLISDLIAETRALAAKSDELIKKIRREK